MGNNMSDKPSEMTAHQLARELLDCAENLENPSEWAWTDQLIASMREAAERLELAADGQGVGPTALCRECGGNGLYNVWTNGVMTTEKCNTCKGVMNE